MKTINVSSAKTSELLAFYNEHADKPVNKFTNLETARRRVTALIETLDFSKKAQAVAKETKAVAKAASKTAKDASALAKTTEATPKAKNTPAKPGYEVEHGKDGDKIVPAARKSNAAGIAASWNDIDVREARLHRQGVIVMVGKRASEFNSTAAAFAALGLPMAKHIRFRMKLKAAGKLTFTHAGKDYEFSIL